MESVEILKGLHGDGVLARMSFRLAAEMLVLGQVAPTLEEALERVERSVQDGSALGVLRKFVTLNGGDARALDCFDLLPQATEITAIRADQGGTIHALDGRALGILAMDLGAGRQSREAKLDLGAGIRVHRTVGDPVQAGDLLFSVHARKGLAVPIEAFRSTVAIGSGPAVPLPWLLDCVS